MKGIYINGTQLNIPDTTLLQGQGRFFQTAGNLLRTHRGIVLIFNLKNIGIELFVLTVNLRTNALPLLTTGVDGRVQAMNVGVKGVITDVEANTLFPAVGIADITHAQRGREGLKIGVFVKLRQSCFLLTDKGLAYRRRGPKQIGHQPAVALQVAQHTKIVFADKVYGCFITLFQFLEQRPEGIR